MSQHSMKTLTDSVLKSNMPLFDGTAASAGLLKPQAVSGFLGKRTLQYNGTYFTYDPRGKDGVGFAPPWSNSKTSPLGDRSPVSQLTGKERQNHMAYRQDSASSEEGHSHSSSLQHPPANQGFTFYSKTSSPTVATSVAVRKPKIGAETPSSPSQSSLYLAIPKPVYGHNPCCNELGCMIGQRYSVDHVSPRIPNTVYEHDWLQTPVHYTEKQSVQRKEALLQQRGLQLERGAEQLKKMSIEAYSPSRVRTLPSVIEPNYSSYPCAPTRTLFGSLSEHSQCLQTSPTGYPSLYTSHPTYEQMTSELYQERSPMSKYGQLTQHPVFYYSQANGEAENSPQCKDSGSKQGEDVSLLHKHIIPKPLEHYVVPQSLHAEIPLSCAEMLPNPSFMRGFEYPYYAVPRFHLNASQIRGPLERQHSSPAFHLGHINVSPSSQQIDLSIAKDKPKTSLHVDQRHSSSPFLRLDQSTPSRCVNQPAISPSSIQMGRGFRPLGSLHRDAPIFPGADVNADRLRDFSTCRTQAKQPNILPASHAAWQPQSSSHSSQRVHTAVPNGKNARKIVHSPAVITGSKHNGFALNTGTTAKKRCLKRSISHSSPSIKIEEEDKDVYEVELSSKQQKVEMENVKKGNKTDSPPMPVIDNVFSLAPCQLHLQSSGVLFPGRVPERATHEDKCEQNIKEGRSGQADWQPPVSPVSKETSPDIQAQEAEAEVFKPKDIKVEKEDESDMGNCVESQNEYRKVIVKTEPQETGSLGSEPMLVKKKCETDELERKPTTLAEKEVSDNCNRTELTAQINSSSPCDALHKQAITLQPKSIHPLQLPESKVNFKNIPPHYLKLSTYRIIIPDGKQCNTAPPSEKPSPQPVTSPSSKQDLETPVRKHFFELHHSLCKLVSKCVSASTEQDLKNWLSQLEITAPASKATKVEKLSCVLGVKAREVWINEEMKSALHKVLERLREYTSQERCPFPHVMRTGAVFLPMLVVKELLFPMVQGSFIDQVLQEHKVELRPTTLSEEKILIQLHKRACSSRLRRLMSLKHLPDIYTDVVNLLYYTSVCKHLGLNVEPESREQDGSDEVSNSRKSPVFSDIDASPASPSESHHQRNMKDQETCSHLSRSKRKSRVKTSSRHTFLDDFSYDDEAGDLKNVDVEDALKNCDPCEAGNERTDYAVAEQDFLTAAENTTSENSWMCPLTLDELSTSGTETENCLCPSGHQSSEPQVKSKNCSGMILRLRKTLGKGLNGKKACYQAVSEPGADGGCVNGRSTPHISSKVTHRWQRNGSFSHSLRHLSDSPKKKCSPLKYCPYLSSYHGAEHRRQWVLRSAVPTAHRALSLCYPELVGKRIRHLYEEADKSEVWYRGEVLRIHEAHTNPLKTIFEVRYDSEPEWMYYLELLIDYKKGWLEIED